MADDSPPASPTSDTPPPRTTGGGFRWEPPTAEELQNLMPGYTIEKILGRGGMGAVYRGMQTNLDRPVAIKILPPGVEKEDPSFAERFKNEAKVMAKLMHPGVVSVFDFGTTSAGQLYFVMEYVDGTDVSQMIAAQRRLPPEHALAITAHVCDALQAAHELGIVHRDIKPANVLINMKGQVKVADFGLAKIEEPGSHGLTKTGYAMGTPDFVAPEALMLGCSIDGRADLYAVGVMLYQMLTGNIPRGAFKPASVLVPGLDPRFDAIILKAMQHDRAERHQSATELRRELDVILTVPLVQHNAPASAAIPVAQMAQAPGQRSVAQKPVGKAPQPRQQGSADTPVSSSPNGSVAAKNHEAGKSARAPLFIGIAAAAAIGIGAFVMLSGGKKEAPPKWSAQSSVRSDETPPAPKPAQGTERTTLPASPPKTAPKPAPATVSASPSPAASKSSEPQFPPGKWVKVFTKLEDLPEDLRKAGVKFEDGWIRFGGVKRYLRFPSVLAGNYGIRFTFIRQAEVNDQTRGPAGISVRLQPGESDGYNALHTKTSFVCNRRDQGKDIKLLSVLCPAIPKTGDEGWLEFFAVGSRLIGRTGTDFVVSTTDPKWARGSAKISGSEDIRDIEVINLDGLSEAEALKILGVDEKGNDLRQPAVAASATPAPAGSKPSASPVPSSPSPLVSKSSDPKFPPGQWVKVLTKAEDLPENLRKAGVRFEGEWIRSEIGKAQRLYVLDSLSNYAIRATMQRQGKEYQTKTFMIRATQPPSVLGYMLCLSTDNFWFGGRKSDGTPSNEILWQAHDSTVRVPRIGEEYTLEWGCVGDKLIGRIGKDYVKLIKDTKWSRGPAYFTGGEPIRDIEVINLDGLPEAEALRILGVDEKGNDLRALAAKQEEMQKAQAAQVDAMTAIPELKALHEQFMKLQAERVTAPFEADVAKLNTGYLGGLDRKIGEEKKAGHLDGVLALEAEKALVAGKQPVPTEDDEKTTAALKELRQIYRDAFAKLEATRAANLKLLTDPLAVRLKQLESTLTQQNRIEHAKTVREYREGLGKEGSADTPVRNASTGGAAATMNEAGKSARAPVAIAKATRSKPDAEKSRQAAEYALRKGCEVSIDHDGTIVPIKKAEDLPKGRWGLHRVKFMTPASDEDLQAVTRAVELKELQCNDRVADSTFTTLAPLGNTPGLKILLLKRAAQECSAEDARALLQSADTLEQLTWLRQPRNDTLLQTVTACQNLNFLYLPDTELTDDDLDQLRSLYLLRSFSLRGSRLTDAGARNLAKFKPLIRLIIADAQENGATPLTPTGLATITKTHGDTLIQLNIGSYGSPHTEGMLRVIATDCPVLEQLTLRGEASPEALAGLSKLKKLKQIDFGRATGKPIPLSIAHCQAVGSIKSLENIGAYDCDLTDAHVQALAGLKSLKSLNLNRNPAVTDASVPVLLSIQTLETLSLGDTSLTPAGVLKLVALPKLKLLSISNKDFTDAHIAQFKAAHPGCNVTR